MFSFALRQRATLWETLFQQHTRQFAKQRRKQKPPREAEAKLETPRLKDTVRKLQWMVHPDKFAQHPEIAAVNEASLSVLQGFLSSIKTLEGKYPQAENHNLRFFLRAPEGDDFQQVTAPLRSTGGNCQKLIEVQLAKLFEQCGLTPTFTWDTGFWEMGDAPKRPKPADDHDEPTVFCTAAPDYNFLKPVKNKAPEMKTHAEEAAPTDAPQQQTDETEFPRGMAGVHKVEIDPEQQTRVNEELEKDGYIVDLGQALETLDPLLEAVAAVQWIKEDDTRVQLIRTDVIDHLEENGWKIRIAAQALWRGERDISAFKKTVDPNSYAMIVQVLRHITEFEAEEAPLRKDPALQTN